MNQDNHQAYKITMFQPKIVQYLNMIHKVTLVFPPSITMTRMTKVGTNLYILTYQTITT